MEDTMEDVVDGESGVELSADEEQHIRYLRDKKISAKAVSDRIETAMTRSTSGSSPAAEPMVSMKEVRTMFVDHTKTVEENQRAREAQKDIKKAIGEIIDESGLTKRSKRRGRVVDEVFQSLCNREDVLKLVDEDFHKVLIDETKSAIAEEREDDSASPPSSTTTTSPKEDEGRKTAAEKMGQTNGNEPPPKSAAQTERPAGNRVTAENVDESFGAEDVNWNLTDAQVEQETAREGEKFLRKARGG